jgi:hypothetical protein
MPSPLVALSKARVVFVCSHTGFEPRSRHGKGKVVTVLFLTEHHTMKAYWGVEV